MNTLQDRPTNEGIPDSQLVLKAGHVAVRPLQVQGSYQPLEFQPQPMQQHVGLSDPIMPHVEGSDL